MVHSTGNKKRLNRSGIEQFGESICHFVTNRINEMLEHLTESGHDRICGFEIDTRSIVERR
ncbi:hypothetical protein MF628_08240 [Paenibacillus polymyxa]|uniref:hypothetical protein n=1 Tax=Paenibacillus polymyxa TaxID=1406 RepID=UPI0020247036|nr:hypothetical protein [Paenibacillus polymyxa]WDZ64112.1 hypothetical protein MF628_08240 [Paenibacillus polymyxa]